MPILRCITIGLALLAVATALPAPAGAQFFGDRYPYYQPRRPPPPSREFFSFPFFHDRPQYQYAPPFIRAPQPVESTKAPPPRKYETPPVSTVVVIGDSLADWLAYGLEETLAESPEIGVARKIRPTSGLVRYEAHNDTLEWSQAVKDVLATEKPAAIVVMLGLNDRLPLRDRAPPPRPGAAANPALADAAQGKATNEPAQQEGEHSAAAAAEAQHAAPGGSYDFHTDKWAELYAKRIDDMIAALKSKGAPVLWVGLPAIRGPRSSSDMSYLDELFRERAEKAGIVYVDIWDGFVDENGRYTVQGPDFEGQTRRLRSVDGVHFTKAGAVKLAHYVEHELRRVMSNRVAPVAMPAPEEQAPAKGGGNGARPVAGPVVPLTAAAAGEQGDLLGAGGKPVPVSSDPIAARVLNRGDAIAAPSGRADDFSWPRPDADAGATADTEPQPVALTPAVPAKKGAAKNDAKGDVRGDAKNDAKSDAKNDTKNKAAPDGSAVRPRRSPNAVLDGAATSVR